jgi:hypothetical protein
MSTSSLKRENEMLLKRFIVGRRNLLSAKELARAKKKEHCLFRLVLWNGRILLRISYGCKTETLKEGLIKIQRFSKLLRQKLKQPRARDGIKILQRI